MAATGARSRTAAGLATARAAAGRAVGQVKGMAAEEPPRVLAEVERAGKRLKSSVGGDDDIGRG